ncbi:hypothetical protein PLAN_100135 [Planktothrix rubescens CCAP 1459/22]|uniref:Uncharacterized protein n=1 Tax=Planktothrix rubescens CCAP 1459/22 TaxID=329571 RepID=A0A6J7ZF63_PLARU|nr:MULTISPECIES: tetratricopeptide repeat protein [Planktothrix]CAC5340085.1 hypothetical protein PLAN_100135 [Planktothrix rubescens NIVA-CYA 18]
MKSEPQPAYLNLINQLLTCASGEEQEILNTHPELLDDGLVAAMLEKADNLREQGELNNANRLKDFAGILGKVDGDFLAGIALKAEADRVLEQGNQQYAISQFREALQSWEQALTIYREIEDRQGEANSLGNLGNAYLCLGQFQKAIAFHQQSLEIAREIGYRQGEAASLGSLGNAYYSLGQFQKALGFYEQSLEIAREIGYRQGEAACLCGLGAAYYSLGQYERAIAFHEQLLEMAREIGYRLGEAASLGNLGEAYYSLGQYQQATECHQQYLEISREIGFRQGESIALNNLGNTLLKTHQLAEAETALRDSIKIHETLRSELVNNDHKASIFEIQVESYRLLQQVLVAQTRFDQALEISEMSRTRAFVELLQQTLLTTPPQSPPYQWEEVDKSPLTKWGLSESLPLKPPIAKGGLGGYQFPKSNKSPATETPQ